MQANAINKLVTCDQWRTRTANLTEKEVDTLKAKLRATPLWILEDILRRLTNDIDADALWTECLLPPNNVIMESGIYRKPFLLAKITGSAQWRANHASSQEHFHHALGVLQNMPVYELEELASALPVEPRLPLEPRAPIPPRPASPPRQWTEDDL